MANITPVQRFWRLLTPDKQEVKNIYIYAVFSGLVNLSLPLGIQAIIGLIQGGRISASWVLLVVIVIGGVAITGVLQIFQLRITEQLQRKIFVRAAFEFVYRIPRIRLEALFQKYAPELMNRFFDTLSVQKGLSKILIDFSRATLQVIFGLMLLSFYHPFFILFSLLLVVFIYAIFRFTAARGLESSLTESKYKYKVAHWLEEVARTNIIFRLAAQSKLAMNRTDELTEGYLHAREDHFKVLIRQYSMLVVFKVLVATGLLAIGGVLVMEQQMNIGQFVAAEIIILLIMGSVEKLIVSTETIYDVLTALEKIGQVTDLPLSETSPTSEPKRLTRPVEVGLEEVTFSYPGVPKPTLEKFSLSFKPGERWVFQDTGHSEGEAILRLIAGLYRPQAGNVLYNGRLRSAYTPDDLYDQVAYLPVDDQLFIGTIIENVSVGRDHVHRDEVEYLVKSLGLGEVVRSLPEGYDTIMYPGEHLLTPSAKQRLLLARCLAGKPSVVLLFHPYQNLSGKERKIVTDFIMQAEHEWTVLAVTQEDTYIKKADKVALMSEGKVKEQGTTEELKHLLTSNTDYYA